MSEEIKKKKDSKVPAGLGAALGGTFGAIPLRGAQDIALGSLVDDFAKDMGTKAVDNPSKIMKRVGVGKIAIPAVVGAYLANRLYKGKNEKEAYFTSQDLEKLAQENPELAEEISKEALYNLISYEEEINKEASMEALRRIFSQSDELSTTNLKKLTSEDIAKLKKFLMENKVTQTLNQAGTDFLDKPRRLKRKYP